MISVDYIFIAIYLIGILVIGGIFSTKMKNSKDMFVAGRNSSWWVAGLSGYMTIFSAGTFVVWGGIAYRLGLVAVSILTTIGFSLILVGFWISGKWREIGIKSPAEFLGIRFGKTTVTLYTLLGIIGRGVSVSVALYAVSILMVALIPLPEGHMLANPETGNLSVTWAILIVGITSVVYTVAGGLWAVLMTDVVQFILLVLMIVLIVPFSFKSVGGVGNFIEQAPEGFFNLVSGEYSFIWLILWFFLWFFQVSGDWPFVQRYISVPSAKDAKKVAYLMAVLYIVTPLIWMLPSMVYRVINPDANPEQAYILISQHVFPPGMLGLMMAAMISSTMSMVDSMLNVFAGVFTYDIYKTYKPKASEKQLVYVGRTFTFGFGAFVVGLALLIPFLGGAERVVVTLITLMIGPLAIPAVWGLFSKYINQKAVWISLSVAYAAGLIVKLGFSAKGLLVNLWHGGTSVATYIQANAELVDALIGLVIPVVILLIMELAARSKGIDAGWQRFVQFIKKNKEDEEGVPVTAASKLPDRILVWAFAILGVAVGWLAVISSEQQKILILFSVLLLSIPVIVFVYKLFKRRKK